MTAASPSPRPSDATPRERPPRWPALVQAGAVALVLAVVAAVSLTARQPPPPSVAEYAPQAVAQIKQAPPEQSSVSGRAGGPDTATTAPSGLHSLAAVGAGSSTSQPVIERPRVRHCVGDPPRQIEDPQSPPCVPYFDPKQDNGGATSHGVTATDIRVFYTPDFLEDIANVNILKDFFNKRFEFYGRQLVFDTQTAGGTTNPDPSVMQADAEKAYDDNDFASLNYVSRQGAEFSFYDSLAAKGVLSVAHRAQAEATDSHFRAKSPFEWSVVPTVDSIERNIGQFVCSSLAGKRPAYAGGAQAQATSRVFGLVVEQAADNTAPDPAPLRSELRRCGADVAAVSYDQVTGDSTRTGQGEMVAMSNAQVTSVICLCDALEARQTLMPAASAQAYQPEWLLSSYLDNDLDNSMSQAPPDQAAHVFGLVFRNKLLPKQDMPFYWAVKEMSPTADPQGNSYYAVNARYLSLLVLASGIQLAGPHLSPSTFAAALFRTGWANPGAGGPPYYQARAGFDGGRHTFIDDATLFWYNPSQRGTVDPDSAGAVCYVDHGTRHGVGDWPASDPAFFTSSYCL